MTKNYYYQQASCCLKFCILDLQTEYCFVAACVFFNSATSMSLFAEILTPMTLKVGSKVQTPNLESAPKIQFS